MILASFFTMVALTVSTLSPLGLPVGRNSIEGRITAPGNASVDNILVFLLSDTYSQITKTFTDGSGRYAFRNLDPGNYYVEVEPNQLGYERQTQRIEVNPYDPTRRGSAEVFRLDIALQVSKPARSSSVQIDTAPADVFFAQSIPTEAKDAFDQATQDLKKEDLKSAEADLVRAIKIFPDYYIALETLGTEYVKHGFYDSAAPLLAHAVEVNKDAWHSYYGLGVSLIELGRRKDGIEALRRSVNLNPKSVNASARLGLELAKDEQSIDEAIKLLSGVVDAAGNQIPDAYLALASLYSKKERYGDAADALEKYLQASPNRKESESIKRKIDDLRQKQKQSKTNS